MRTPDGEVTTDELGIDVLGVLNRVQHEGERVGVVRDDGKLAAVLVGVGDHDSLEAFEAKQDVIAYDEAKAIDDGGRVSAEDLRRELEATAEGVRQGTIETRPIEDVMDELGITQVELDAMPNTLD